MPRFPVAEETVDAYLAELVAIPSVNPSLDPQGTGEAAIAEQLAAYLGELGFELDRQLPAPDRPTVIGRWRGAGGGRRLLLNGHTDTVSAAGMTIPAFEPHRDGPWLYGRGACDMKSGLAAILAAARALRGAGVRPRGDLVVAFTPDEEYASIGMDLLVTHPWVAGADAAVITEPTELVISTCHKGFGWYEIVTTGRAAHGSRPDLGVDAIYHMGRVLGRLEALDAALARRGVHPLMGRTAVHASLISGGTELSTYPPRCTLQVEWRTLPDDPPGEAPARLQALLDELAAADPAFRASLRTMFERGAFALPVDHPIVLALRDAGQRVLGRPPALGGMTGWPESEVLNRAGIPAVLFGPSGEGAHAALERADVPSVARCAEVLAELVVDWCGAAG